MNKLVSIILPTHNGAVRIIRAIHGVLAQSYTNWELLVLDDGSTDNTKELIESITKNESRVKYFKNDINLGLQETLNRGLNEAKGEYVARIDDDDEWINIDKLANQIKFLEENNKHLLVGTGFIAVDEKGKEVFRRRNPEEDKRIRCNILRINCFVHSGVLFNKEGALKCGGYSTRPEVKHIEDYDLWLRLGTLGKLANLPDYSVRLELRSESISSKNKINQLKKSIKLIGKYKDCYPNYFASLVSLYIRLLLLIVFQTKPLQSFSSRLYKVYKNI
jgi:glycosyltransferase involved in cell wall biosynthesis